MQHDLFNIVEPSFSMNEETLKVIKDNITKKYAHEYSKSSFVRRIIIRVRIWKEVKREIAKRHPRDALY